MVKPSKQRKPKSRPGKITVQVDVVDGTKVCFQRKFKPQNPAGFVLQWVRSVKCLDLTPQQALFMFVNGNVLVTPTKTLGEVYSEYHKDYVAMCEAEGKPCDECLHIQVFRENTFG